MGNGIYETYIADMFPKTTYQYCITTKGGKKIYKSDLYANEAELRPGRCSVVTDETKVFDWEDDIRLKNETKEVGKGTCRLENKHCRNTRLSS